jgi:amidase
VFSHDVVTALVKAGFNLIGQTASPELGALPITESALYGDTRNPWNLAHTPGGSSGGSAAAVCANLVPVAEGSDGGGSIRIPASCCGLVGLKPSRGRVFVGPILSASEISMRGVLTKNVSDTAAILDVIKTTDSAQWHVALDGESSFLQSLKHPMNKKLRIAFCLTSPLGGPVDSECKLAVEKTARLFEEAGHIVNEGAPDWGFIDQFVDDFMLYWSALMGELEAEDESQFEPHTRHLRESARNTSAVEFRRAMTRLQRTSRGIVQSWETNFDLLITPTIASLPPKVGEITDGSMEDPTVPIQRSFTMVPFTGWFNVTGQPAISLPVHMSKSGLPVGVQLIAGPWCDRLLLQIAHWVESAIDFPHWSKDLLTPTT